MPFPPLAHDRRTSDAIIDVLVDAGIEHVFGMPGGHTGVLFAALHEHPTIRVVQVREESIGSMAAEAYGRLSDRPAVVMGQGEWLLGNAGQGHLEALLGCSPVIILTEMTEGASFAHHGPYQGGSGDYGAWDAKNAFQSIVKRVMVSRFPAQAVQHTQLAIKHALTGEPGPVAVVFHSDAVRGRVGPASVPAIYPTAGYLPQRSTAFDRDTVEAATSVLRTAASPVIIAGNGVRVGGAYAELERLAAALDAPVATTAAGKSVLPETHPLAVGVIGAFGHPSAIAAVAAADVIVAVGTKLGPMDTADETLRMIDPSRQTMIHIDVEPLNVGWTYPVDHALIGDAGVVMAALADRCPAASRDAATRVADLIEQHSQLGDPRFLSDEVPFFPQRIVSLLQDAAPDDTIVTCDAGENRLFMMQWFRSVSPGGYLQPAGGGSMGYAVPAAIGAKVARPDQPVVAVCGDGGFAMSIHALMTAVQERIPIGIVVLDNNALGWVLHGMGKRATAAGLDDFDHAAIARSVGCGAASPTNVAELRQAFADMFASDVPYLIDVPTSIEVSYQEIEALTRLAASESNAVTTPVQGARS